MFFLVASVITVPFTGILVRYRLAYCPKISSATTDPEAATSSSPNASTTSPDASTSENPLPSNATSTSSSPPVLAGPDTRTTDATSFWNVAKRVYQIEGKSGLYKGLFPTLLVNFLWMNPRSYISPAPLTFQRTLIDCLIGTLFYTFTLVWVYRLISTRTKLEFFGSSIKDGINALFTPYELARPYRIVTPSLLLALIGQVLLQVLVLRPLRQMVQPSQDAEKDVMYYSRWGATMALLIVSTGIFAPLDVIVTRLAAQRNFGAVSLVTDELPAAAVPVEVGVPHSDEKVSDIVVGDEVSEPCTDNVAVKYREDDMELYTSVYDCAKKIIQEEGWTVLYRGWILTLLGIW
ncbi:hypothetical protein H0H92_015085 [Tricholoma furcatifolium]|nr:hypothetical protein H0H92_015085 [Tricholoma furcatifolium]